MPEPDNTRGNHPPNTSYPAGLKLPACTTDLTQPGAFRLFSSSAVMTQVADDFVVTCLCFWVRRSCLFTWGRFVGFLFICLGFFGVLFFGLGFSCSFRGDWVFGILFGLVGWFICFGLSFHLGGFSESVSSSCICRRVHPEIP